MIPEWMEPHTRGVFKQEYTIRIMHPYRADGSPCSINKSGGDAEACSIYRKNDGWYAHCFRCGFSAFYKDGYGSPEEVQAKLKRMKIKPYSEAVAEVKLPEDFVTIFTDGNKPQVPMEAVQWLWGVGLTDQQINYFGFGWSPGYQRVIIPCLAYGILKPSGDFAHTLVGWIGREVKYKSKAERKKHNCVKYLTKKHNKVRHLMFFAPGEGDRFVIVEDVLSAIRVNSATGYNAIALLTTFIPRKLMLQLVGKRTHIWLDGDMMAKSVGYSTQMNRLGAKTNYIHTQRDPKDYSDEAIRSQFKEE